MAGTIREAEVMGKLRKERPYEYAPDLEYDRDRSKPKTLKTRYHII
jgi:hypothetical protein